MPTPPVSGRLRSACVVLDAIEQHTPAVQAFWAGTARPGGSYSAEDAMRNMADLMRGTADTLQNRSRMLHAFDALVEVERPQQPFYRELEAAELRLRLLWERLRESSAQNVFFEIQPLSRDIERLLRRSLQLVERLRGEPRDGGPAREAAEALEEAVAQIEEAIVLLDLDPPALAEMGRIRAMDAFDETLEDTVEMVRGMLQLCGRSPIAEGLRTSWVWPGWLQDRHALNAISAEQVALLLGEALLGAFDPVPLDADAAAEDAGPDSPAFSS